MGRKASTRCCRRPSSKSSLRGPAMLSRRAFLSGAAAIGVRAATAGAQTRTYDLMIRGGRVIDPASRVDALRDVTIAGGRIAVVARNIAGDATGTIDARGKLVVPGLLDIHTHVAR